MPSWQPLGIWVSEDVPWVTTTLTLSGRFKRRERSLNCRNHLEILLQSNDPVTRALRSEGLTSVLGREGLVFISPVLVKLAWGCSCGNLDHDGSCWKGCLDLPVTVTDEKTDV